MTAPFAPELCGYRKDTGNPSTSDNSDSGSIEWGRALFKELGVAPTKVAVHDVGAVVEQRAVENLLVARPDLNIRRSRKALEFEQYAHLGVFKDFSLNYEGPTDLLEGVSADLAAMPKSLKLLSVRNRIKTAIEASRRDHELVSQLRDTMPEESLLKVDITVGSPSSPERMLLALSAKWSLRTDRAQDCVSQGSKLVSLRRGHMPHFGVLTMEPRPAMLRLLASGSGAVDCVYHLALPELRAAAKVIAATKREGIDAWPQRLMLERMVAQGRLRSYQDLVTEVTRLPKW